MAETKHAADWVNTSVYMGTTGSTGDLCWISGSPTATGTGLTAAAKGLQFAGVIQTNATQGSYATVATRGVFNLTKGNGTGRVLQQGEKVYGSGATAVSTAAVSSGSVIGIVWEQSSSDNGSAAVSIFGMVSPAHG